MTFKFLHRGNSIHNRIWVILLLFLISTFAAYLADTAMLRTSLLREKTVQTRHVVETAHAVLAHYRSLEKLGRLSETDARQGAIEAVRSMRYGENEYFWINDLGQPSPRMVMHPIQPELEGQILDAAKYESATQISHGDSNEFLPVSGSKNIFNAFQEIANQSSQGLVRYQWQKPLADGRLSEQTFEKLSFVKKFDDWGWVIGSGVYIDDIDRALGEQTQLVLTRASLSSLLLLLIVGGIAYGIRQIELELKNSKIRMQTLIDATSESVLLLGKQGEIQAINLFGAKRFQKKPEDLLTQDFYSMLPEKLARSRRNAVEQVLATGAPLVIRDDRNGTHFENTLYPVFDQNGEASSVAVYAKDVTEAHQSKAIDEIFRHLDSVLLKWQMESRIVAQIFCDNILPVFNLAAAWIGKAESDGRISIIAKAESMGESFLDEAHLPSHVDAAEADWPPVSAVLRSGYRQIAEIDPKQTQPHVVSALSAGLESAISLPLQLQKKTWGTLTLYSRDARLLVDAQQRLAAVTSRLSVSLESALQQEWLSLLNSALTGIDQAVFICNAERRIIWSNQAFSRISGYSQEDILEKAAAMFHVGLAENPRGQEIDNMTGEGKTFDGELDFQHREGHVFPVHAIVTPLSDGDGLINHYVTIIEDISQRRSMEIKVRHLADYDRLTDIPNRALFQDRLDQAVASARRSEQPGALLFIDLDGFKAINDQHGHATGDTVLIEVARRIKQLVRESDTVARLGGDEFTVILPNLGNSDDAVQVAGKIQAELARPLQIDAISVAVGSSIGIAFFPHQYSQSEALLNAADNAMYQAKQSGRNAIVCADATFLPANAPKERDLIAE